MRNLKNYTSVNMQILQRQKYNNKSVLLSRKQNLVKWLLNHKGLHKNEQLRDIRISKSADLMLQKKLLRIKVQAILVVQELVWG